MMITALFQERPRGPALHPGGGHGDPIDTPFLYRNVAADIHKALPSEKLASTGNVFGAGKAEIIVVLALDERRPGHPEFQVSGEPAKKEFEIVRFEGDIGVQIPDDIEAAIAELFVPGIERVDLRREAAFHMGRSPDQFNPRMFGRVARYDLVSPIGGAIADDDPPGREGRLRNDGADRVLDEVRLIPCRSFST